MASIEDETTLAVCEKPGLEAEFTSISGVVLDVTGNKKNKK